MRYAKDQAVVAIVPCQVPTLDITVQTLKGPQYPLFVKSWDTVDR